ncbi:helix-turn-helix domain-containing protein [Flavobacterium microcysteis]|uniref:Helix-turn-helix transcriptional regulator n=1 Tax=Flavobacterium microcysteis TaxID=2596891 RepID=A0A501QE31_9FLAO|nr:helix-turn-helix transcriptional regulator [Flavobacterium microcysteis]TPD70421.1 helix-turn-helix transcriptional regulator [Flavobacterium microcysteis]
MVNTDDFIKRIEKILDYYNLTASSFADKIGVQRSSISHLLSGRNKPSLDFILKILDVFPEIDLYWILNGKGSFPKSNETPSPTPISEPIIQNSSNPIKEVPTSKNTFSNDTIEKIVIFYKDGSFKEYHPQ